MATTGLSAEDKGLLAGHAREVPIFVSANMSLGINLVRELIQQAAAVLGQGFDIEIVEKHHNQKKDSPSGTALLLADALNEVFLGTRQYVYGRHARSELRDGKEIGIHAVRAGTIVGEHEVLFAGKDEVVEFRHTAYSRQIFASGALQAARYLIGKPPGLYGMKEMITAGSAVTRLYVSEEQALLTLLEVPYDTARIAAVFQGIARENISVDMISQTAPVDGRVEISFTLPRADLDRARAPAGRPAHRGGHGGGEAGRGGPRHGSPVRGGGALLPGHGRRRGAHPLGDHLGDQDLLRHRPRRPGSGRGRHQGSLPAVGPMRIGVYGLGRFGVVLRRVCWPARPRSRPFPATRTAPRPAGVRRVGEEELLAMPAVCLCVDIGAMPEVLARIAPRLPAGSLVLDTCSVKELPVRWMRELLPPAGRASWPATRCSVRTPGHAGCEGLPMILWPVRLERGALPGVGGFFASFGLAVHRLAPEEHDRQAAFTQGLTHYLGRVLAELDLEPSAIGSRGLPAPAGHRGADLQRHLEAVPGPAALQPAHPRDAPGPGPGSGGPQGEA